MTRTWLGPPSSLSGPASSPGASDRHSIDMGTCQENRRFTLSGGVYMGPVHWLQSSFTVKWGGKSRIWKKNTDTKYCCAINSTQQPPNPSHEKCVFYCQGILDPYPPLDLKAVWYGYMGWYSRTPWRQYVWIPFSREISDKNSIDDDCVITLAHFREISPEVAKQAITKNGRDGKKTSTKIIGVVPNARNVGAVPNARGRC